MPPFPFQSSSVSSNRPQVVSKTINTTYIRRINHKVRKTTVMADKQSGKVDYSLRSREFGRYIVSLSTEEFSSLGFTSQDVKWANKYGIQDDTEDGEELFPIKWNTNAASMKQTRSHWRRAMKARDAAEEESVEVGDTAQDHETNVSTEEDPSNNTPDGATTSQCVETGDTRQDTAKPPPRPTPSPPRYLQQTTSSASKRQEARPQSCRSEGSSVDILQTATMKASQTQARTQNPNPPSEGYVPGWFPDDTVEQTLRQLSIHASIPSRPHEDIVMTQEWIHAVNNNIIDPQTQRQAHVEEQEIPPTSTQRNDSSATATLGQIYKSYSEHGSSIPDSNDQTGDLSRQPPFNHHASILDTYQQTHDFAGRPPFDHPSATRQKPTELNAQAESSGTTSLEHSSSGHGTREQATLPPYNPPRHAGGPGPRQPHNESVRLQNLAESHHSPLPLPSTLLLSDSPPYNRGGGEEPGRAQQSWGTEPSLPPELPLVKWYIEGRMANRRLTAPVKPTTDNVASPSRDKTNERAKVPMDDESGSSQSSSSSQDGAPRKHAHRSKEHRDKSRSRHGRRSSSTRRKTTREEDHDRDRTRRSRSWHLRHRWSKHHHDENRPKDRHRVGKRSDEEDEEDHDRHHRGKHGISKDRKYKDRNKHGRR